MGDASMRNQASCDDRDRPIMEVDGSVSEDEALVDTCQDVSFSSSEMLEDQTMEALSCSGTLEREVSDVDDSPIDFYKEPPYIDFTAKAPKAKRRVFDAFRYIMPRNYLKREPLDDSLMTMKNYILVKSEVKDTEDDNEHAQPGCSWNNATLRYSGTSKHQEMTRKVFDESKNVMDRNYLKREPSDDSLMNYKRFKTEVEDSEEDCKQEYEDYNYNDPQYGVDTNNQESEGVVAGELMENLNENKEANMKHIKTRMEQILRECDIFLQNTDNSEIRSVKFSTVYDKLRSGPPQDICEGVSMPMAFFVLMDLATETSLHLKMSENIQDVLITNEIPLPPHLR